MKKIFFAFLACAALCACSSDDIISDAASTTSTDDVYMKFNIKMSNATRTATGETTTIEGTTDENAVTDVLVLLAQQGSVKVSGEYQPGASTSSEYVVKFTSEELESLAGSSVDVYIYCNNSDVTADNFSADGTCSIGATEATDGVTITTEPWKAGSFMMSNASTHQSTLPGDLSPYNSEANAWDLGVVDVERSAARFDYKATETDNSYTITDGAGENYTITIEEAALINLNTGFYYLRHTAENTSGSVAADLTNIELLGTETANNWVVDWDATFKSTYASGTSLASNFTYRSTTPTIWKWLTPTSGTDYATLTYATENTLPSAASYIHGLATGIVFKASIAPQNGSFTTTTGRIYVYGGTLYDGWDAVATAAEEEGGSLKVAYDYVMSVAGSGQFDEYDETISEAMKEEGFTGYSPDENGTFYAYYYYWNEHNAPVADGVTPGLGIMEYGVVRNNVYQLSVTDITGFGHPTPPVGPDDPNYPGPTPDPDPDDPTDPDTPIVDQSVHFQVEVNILPWTLRENAIEF